MSESYRTPWNSHCLVLTSLQNISTLSSVLFISSSINGMVSDVQEILLKHGKKAASSRIICDCIKFMKIGETLFLKHSLKFLKNNHNIAKAYITFGFTARIPVFNGYFILFMVRQALSYCIHFLKLLLS